MFLPPQAMPHATVDVVAMYQVKLHFNSWRRRARQQRQLATGVENAIKRVLEAIEAALLTPPGNQIAWNGAIAQLRGELGLLACVGGDYPDFQAFAGQQESFLAGRGVL